MTRPGVSNARARAAGMCVLHRCACTPYSGVHTRAIELAPCRDMAFCVTTGFFSFVSQQWSYVGIELRLGRELLCRDRELFIAKGLGHGRRSSYHDLMLWVATEFGPEHGNRVMRRCMGWHDESRECGATNPSPWRSVHCLGAHKAEGARDTVQHVRPRDPRCTTSRAGMFPCDYID